jgi:ParB family chromosome partitioning protein
VITEALSLNRMPESVQERCRQADIESKSMLLQIVRQDTEDAMHQLVDRITGEGITREQARRFNRAEPGDERRPKRYVFRYAPEDEAFQFSLSFPRPDVQKAELVTALQSVLERLIRELHDDVRLGATSSMSPKKARPPEPTV